MFTKQEKREIENLPTIGYWSALGGVDIKRIDTELGGETNDQYILCVVNAWQSKHTYHRVRIKYTHSKDSRAYIEIEGVKLYLDQCVRSGM